MKRYLTPERAAEVVEMIKPVLMNCDLSNEESEEIEILLAMTLDAPLRGRLERVTWSAFEAGAKYGLDYAHTAEVTGYDVAVTMHGDTGSAYERWRREFPAEDEKREDAPSAQAADELRILVLKYFAALDAWAGPDGGRGHQEGTLNRAEDELRKAVGNAGVSCTIGNTRGGP